MDTTIWPVVDNTTEVQHNITSGNNLQTVTLGTPKTMPLTDYIGYTIGFTAASIGIIANAVVLVVLIRARREFGSNVNTLIINQTILDFLACCFIFISIIFYITDRLVYNGSRLQIVDNALCIFIDAGALPGVCMTGGKVGLVVITLERYFKIVHAIAHRKYYRDWMTKVGVALPWIGGICFVLIPSIGTTRIIRGTCMRLTIWPNKAMALVSTYVIVS